MRDHRIPNIKVLSVTGSLAAVGRRARARKSECIAVHRYTYFASRADHIAGVKVIAMRGKLCACVLRAAHFVVGFHAWDTRFKESSPSFELSERMYSGRVENTRFKGSIPSSRPSRQIQASYPTLELLDAGAMTGHQGT